LPADLDGRVLACDRRARVGCRREGDPGALGQRTREGAGEALRRIDVTTIKLACRFRIREVAERIDLRFLAAIGAGAVAYATIKISGARGDMVNVISGTVAGGSAYLVLARLIVPQHFATFRKISTARRSGTSDE